MYGNHISLSETNGNENEIKKCVVTIFVEIEKIFLYFGRIPLSLFSRSKIPAITAEYASSFSKMFSNYSCFYGLLNSTLTSL